MNTLDHVDAKSLRDDIPAFRPGDTLKVHVRVIEGTRSRIQIFQGVKDAPDFSIRWQCYPGIHGPRGNRRFRYASRKKGSTEFIHFSIAFHPIALFGKAFEWRCTGVNAIVGMVGLRCKTELFVSVNVYLCMYLWQAHALETKRSIT